MSLKNNMKRIALMAVVVFAAMLFTSCRKYDYTDFIGTWGVEKLEYYNIDYQGNPIPNSGATYYFDPNSSDNGIQLVFRADKTGELRDSAIDTLWIKNEETGEYDSCIYCPDTTIVKTFTCSFDESENTLYLNMEYVWTYRLIINSLSKKEFIYETEYDEDYMERAFMKRISKKPTKSTDKTPVRHPHKKPGSLFGDR